VEPASDVVASHDGSSLANQNQKRRLKGILDIVIVFQNPAANPENHRTEPSNQSLECVLVLPGKVTVQ
jgi:hypothetical protein